MKSSGSVGSIPTPGTKLKDKMRKIQLTQGKIALVDDEDFKWLSRWKWHICNGYAARKIYNPETQKTGDIRYMHRVILATPKDLHTDHINGNPLDNRRINLRTCTNSQNNMNRHKTRGSSKFKGVHWSKKREKWQAQIWKDSKIRHLGRFVSEEEAALVYNKAARKLFGKFARVNIL